jgi:hypothetical protein
VQHIKRDFFLYLEAADKMMGTLEGYRKDYCAIADKEKQHNLRQGQTRFQFGHSSLVMQQISLPAVTVVDRLGKLTQNPDVYPSIPKSGRRKDGKQT